jgi:hypothetical protein
LRILLFLSKNSKSIKYKFFRQNFLQFFELFE